MHTSIDRRFARVECVREPRTQYIKNATDGIPIILDVLSGYERMQRDRPTKQVGGHRNDTENERHPNGCDVSVWFVELLAVLRENHPNRTTN